MCSVVRWFGVVWLGGWARLGGECRGVGSFRFLRKKKMVNQHTHKNMRKTRHEQNENEKINTKHDQNQHMKNWLKRFYCCFTFVCLPWSTLDFLGSPSSVLRSSSSSRCELNSASCLSINLPLEPTELGFQNTTDLGIQALVNSIEEGLHPHRFRFHIKNTSFRACTHIKICRQGNSPTTDPLTPRPQLVPSQLVPSHRQNGVQKQCLCAAASQKID